MADVSVSTHGRSGGLGAKSAAIPMVVATAFLLALMVLRGHDVGGEVWGPAAGILAVAAAILTVAVNRSSGRALRAVIVLLWVVVIVLGVAGTLEHADPVLPASLDQRSRPALVPLVYSMFGVVGIMMVLARSRSAAAPTSDRTPSVGP